MRKNEALTLANESMDSGNDPRVHPNGFIQLDLDDTGNKRLHIWRNDLPRQKVYTPVHNHRFDFSSITVAGALTNMTFELGDPSCGPLHRLWEVRRDPASEETKLMPTSNIIGLIAVEVSLVTPGNGYDFSAGDFHETGFVHNTVTMIEKTDPVPGIASAVLVPEGIEPDNSFTRALPHVDDLRQKIQEALS
jgi:hypothetical protein